MSTPDRSAATARLVVEIEIPGFNVEDVRCEGDAFEDDDEALEAAMECSEDVIVVFKRWDEVDGNPMTPLEGRIVRRRLV